MKTAYDLKSFFIGVLLATFIILALGAVNNNQLHVGRFRIATNRNHILVVDTVTGQVWEKYVKTTEGTTSENFAEPKLMSRKK